MLSMIEEIIRDLLIFVAVMFALSIVLLVVVSKMPDENPLKRIMTALSYRVGATLAAGVAPSPSSRSRDSTCSTTSSFRSCSSGTGSHSSAMRLDLRPRPAPPTR
jgi:hypothetical protein